MLLIRIEKSRHKSCVKYALNANEKMFAYEDYETNPICHGWEHKLIDTDMLSMLIYFENQGVEIPYVDENYTALHYQVNKYYINLEIFTIHIYTVDSNFVADTYPECPEIIFPLKY